MRWQYTEYILKGLYLGLLLYVALQEPTGPEVGQVALCVGAGLAGALGLAAARKLSAGQNIRGRILPFLVFLLLDNPGLVYAGTLIGLAVGAHWVEHAERQALLPYLVAAGIVLGLVFAQVHQVQDRRVRWGGSFALSAALVGAVLIWIMRREQANEPLVHDPTRFATLLLLGIPPFYLLTFSGRSEESEIEIGALCAVVGLALWMLEPAGQFRSVIFLAPLLLYVAYTLRVLPGVRVFKHAVRGLGHAEVGDHRSALRAYRRALELAPRNRLASEGIWRVHRLLDLAQVAREPETLALVDFDLCLQRASSLLMEPPTVAKLEEAHRLLDLVQSQRPDRQPDVDYWRAVAYCHAQLYDQAALALEKVLDGSAYGADNPHRPAILFSAWQLALVLHKVMIQRVGTPQLAVPGRRMEAIAAVERQLAANPEDASAWELKRVLYSGLAEADYNAAAAAGQPAPDFDHGYAQQLGLALIHDPARWPRGTEYLRLAARGLPEIGPSLYTQIAQAHTRAGDAQGARHAYEWARQTGRAVGPRNLSQEERHVYFAAVKLLADDAVQRSNWAAAIENYHLYTEYERSGIETLRTLADLYERRGDPLAALYVTEQALVYNSSDPDLLERKDKYYYSVLPADLQERLDSVRNAFDIGYCLRKARSLLDHPAADLDAIDWAQHLLDLVLVAQPGSVAARMLRARVHLRKGEKDEAAAILEAIHSNRPERFATSDDEDAWYLSCRLLGELYLFDLGKPDLAVPCFLDFRKSSKSGADTLYKLGQAYEQLGDRERAVKCYQHVAAYDSHPLAPDARDAIDRLQASA
jgi:tetratricopeptide (TPR) repeat protein